MSGASQDDRDELRPWDFHENPPDDILFPEPSPLARRPRRRRTTRSPGRHSWRLPVIAVLSTIVGLLSIPPLVRHTDDLPAQLVSYSNTVSIAYAGAASRLADLAQPEADDQVRDWARIGLAAHLKLDTTRFRDAAYDTLPIRDDAHAGLSRQPSGPGRALYDGRQTLHLLVPHRDRHEARTIGLLIDQHRADSGVDPPTVQIHRYHNDTVTRTINLTSEAPAPTAEVRSARGYVTMRVDEASGLTAFLARTRHLSWLETRGPEIWAGGWHWPDVPAVPLDHEDVSAIQRGHLQPSPPGFSLDPGPRPSTTDEVRAVVPGLSRALAGRVLSGDWRGSRFGSAEALTKIVTNALFDDDWQPSDLSAIGLPTDRTHLWSLFQLLKDGPAYSAATYSGKLDGTGVGMTLFYVDYVAKNWVSGVGDGLPTKAVPGFVPDSEAVVPWSHCNKVEERQEESGRLWFGQNESGFAFEESRVSIGAQATRLFVRSDGATGEQESSYRFGRGLRWWDQHYQAMSDYEPQYQRLNQIMAWSGAVEWLVSRAGRLPQLGDAAIRSGLRFEDWWSGNTSLKERSPIAFLKRPAPAGEAVLTRPSKTYQECGLRVITGGVALGDLVQRVQQVGQRLGSDLPPSIRRSGVFDGASNVDPTTGVGQITQQLWLASTNGKVELADTLRREFSRDGDRAVVDIVAGGRREASLGDLKVWRSEGALRRLRVEFEAGQEGVAQRVEVQGHEQGELVAKATARTVTVTWRRGPIDRAVRILEQIQKGLASVRGRGLPPAKDGVLYQHQNGFKLGGPGEPWLWITDESVPPGEELVFGLGGPPPPAGEPAYHLAVLRPGPEPGQNRSAQWIDVTPPTLDLSAQVSRAGPPGDGTQPIPVTNPEGAVIARLVPHEGHPRVPATDPVLGLDGTAEGAALLRDFPRVAEAMRDAARSADRYLRGVRLGDDAVALVEASKVTLVPLAHPWAAPVLRAPGPTGVERTPLIQIVNRDIANHVDPSPLSATPGSERITLGAALDRDGPDVYLHERLRATLLVPDGAVIPDSLPRDLSVTVRPVVAPLPDTVVGHAWQPDVRIHEGARWYHTNVSGSTNRSRSANRAGTGSGLASGDPSATPSPSSTPSPITPDADGPVTGTRLLLVCPAETHGVPGCGN